MIFTICRLRFVQLRYCDSTCSLLGHSICKQSKLWICAQAHYVNTNINTYYVQKCSFCYLLVIFRYLLLDYIKYDFSESRVFPSTYKYDMSTKLLWHNQKIIIPAHIAIFFTQLLYILCTGLFSPSVFFALLHLKTICPILNLPRHI